MVPTPKEINNISKIKRTQTFQKTYVFVEELGHGQTGRVDKVVYRNGSFERHFARKTCETFADLKRFEREIKMLAKLNHSGIVSIIDADFTPGKAWYIMNFIEGKRLCDYEGTFLEKHEILSHLFESVAYLHQNEIIHRDLKPENIMIRESDGRPVIVDFGSSFSRIYSTLTSTGVGQTIGYFGPEIQADPNSSRLPQNDIFACGVIAYEFLMGNRPDPVDYSQLEIPGVDAGVLENLDKVLRKATQYRVRNRFASVEEMLGVWGEIDAVESPSNEGWKDDVRLAIVENKENFSFETSEISLGKTVTNCLNEELKSFEGNSMKVVQTRFLFYEDSYDYSLFKAELTYSNGSKDGLMKFD